MIENDYIRKDLPDRFSEVDFFKRNFSRILNIYDGIIMPPYEVLIHPCSYCNLFCKWCIGSYVTRDKYKEKILTTNLDKVENMKKIIESIISYEKVGKDYVNGGTKVFKVENVSFSGITGEPMLSKEAILYAIDVLKKHNIRVGMFTNGILLTPDIQDYLLRMDYLLISIDAGNKETYNELKCNGKDLGLYERIFDNIKNLSKNKEKYKSNLDINVGYIVNKYNYDQLYDISKKLKEVGIHYFRLKTDISSQMLLTDEQVKIVKEQINMIKRDIEDDYFRIIEIHKIGNESQKVRDFDKCFIHYLYGAISADGRVYPCNYHPKVNGYSYDSALDNSFENIWENIMKYKIDSEIPSICPDRCDPFKTRANRLLEQGFEIYKKEGIEALKKFIYN